ncbi:MAG TPA: hypothetical protein VGU23_02000, partial [Acidobacteriaceae bacterium]|nr:hypothetical protein [Acidobacteriaceae bacterium]
TFLPLVDCQNVTGRTTCGRSPAAPIIDTLPCHFESSSAAPSSDADAAEEAASASAKPDP